MLGLSLSEGSAKESFELPISIILVCSSVMTLGTLLGGERIIKKTGMEMVSLDAAGAKAADMSSSFLWALCSIFGVPVSTTHSKACALMGVGSLTREGADRGVIRQILLAWLLTFPVCAALGFVLAFLIS